MAKTRVKQPSSKKSGEKGAVRKGECSFANFTGALAAVIFALITSLVGARWWTAKDGVIFDDMALNKTYHTSTAANIGQDVFAGQAETLIRLVSLLRDVEALEGEDKQAERLEASIRVEAELGKIEAKLDPNTPAGKQQLGYVSLVRSALHKDRAGETFSGEDWNDWTQDELRKKHGLVTYASPEFWERAFEGNRYGESFDWYGAWRSPDLKGRSLSGIMRPLLPTTDARMLVLGCGNSNMSALMYEDGYRNIVNIDISESVIDKMKNRYLALKGMEWHVMDAVALTFPNGSYDAIVEKGMFDAFFSGHYARAGVALNEALRVLRPGGRLLSVSFAGDRLEALFGRASKEPAPQLRCEISSQLFYPRHSEGSDADKETIMKYWVYACVRL